MDVAINKGTALAKMAAITAETESFFADIKSNYEELSASITHSQGDFVEALKMQIERECELMEAAGNFFITLLQMMQSAESDFASLDTQYAKKG